MLSGYATRLRTLSDVKSRRPELHGDPPHRIVVVLPLVPYNSSDVDLTSWQVLSIQVGMLAAIVPPGTVVVHRTIPPAVVIVMVAIESTERNPIMIGQSIT